MPRLIKDSLFNFEGENGQKHQGQSPTIVSSESPVKLYCCYAVIAILTVVVTGLSATLSAGKKELASLSNTYAACPRGWIGFGSKCFYFSENTSNWTSSQTLCKKQGAQLAHFDSMEELNFLRRYKGPSDHWIGLHRDSPELPWMWTNNTKYDNLVDLRGNENYAYLSGRGISSGRSYQNRKWICSKSYSYTLECPAHGGNVSQQQGDLNKSFLVAFSFF